MCSFGLAWRNEFRSCIVKDANERCVNHTTSFFFAKTMQKKISEQTSSNVLKSKKDQRRWWSGERALKRYTR